MSSASGCEIVVFAKAPIPGRAKTRLIPQLGAAGAARFHWALVRQALETALASGVGRVQLWHTEDDPDVSALAASLRIASRRQCAGDIGERMSHAFAELLAGSTGVILVGSDCPARSTRDFVEAANALASGADAVLGPTEDGGYHLVALRTMQPRLFTHIDWGTSAVLQQTRARLRTLDLKWQELTVRWDVDRPADLRRLRADRRLAELMHACQ